MIKDLEMLFYFFVLFLSRILRENSGMRSEKFSFFSALKLTVFEKNRKFLKKILFLCIQCREVLKFQEFSCLFKK